LGKKMKKYVFISAGITFLLICTSFVSSSNSFDNELIISNKGPISCNHQGYVIGSGGNCWLNEFTLSNPSDLNCICEGSGLDTYGGAITRDNVIYTSEYATGILYLIDPESCDWYAIGGGGAGSSAISFDPITEYLFSTDGSNLYKIDVETGEQELVGTFDSVQFMEGLAFDTDGTLYGWDKVNDMLWVIDKETAEETQVGSLGIDIAYNSDGDFCKEDNILYITIPGPPPNYRDQLYECDTETGECGHIGQFPEDFTVSIFVIPWINHPPSTPCCPRPMNGTTGVISGPWFTFEGCNDPDGDTVTYDIYFGTTNPPPKVISNGSSPQYDPGPGEFPEPNTTIYWKFVCWDEHGASAEGPIWHYTIPPNYPPYPAKNPNPPDGAEEVPVNAILNWTGWDPNGWDELKYDVYFGLYDPPTQQTSNQTDPWFDPYNSGDMSLFEDYYWKIVTWDREEESSIGPVWTFSTGHNCSFPDPIIDGPSSGRVNVVYNFTFYVETEDRFCFEVNWGDGSPIEIYCPKFNLSYVIANHTWDKMGIFTIWVRCLDEYGQYGEWFSHQMTISRQKMLTYSILNSFFIRYPLLEVFLRLI
jgi:hypothetical protein